MDTKSNVQNLWGYTHEISGGTMKSKKIGMQALKIAIGSSLAIYIANLFGLKYSLAAGSVALLTMVTTKWKTVKLSVARVVTFIISVLMALIIFSAVESEWMAYGIFCGYYRRDAWMGSDDFRKCTDRNAFSGSQRF